ncbi:MAG TPA: RES family NAD+ phosphorylase [Candidatus Angelobacter sp.]|nr:RES family NAD+ phosphorylase [Candidatus Angelobacter sp.]
MLAGWRIVPSEFADTAFDGEGARLYGGRWNSKGVSMVYASLHLSLAALEIRVHIEATSKRKNYSCIAFHFDKTIMRVLTARDLPKNWQHEPSIPSAKRIGDSWVESKASVILGVPSVVVPEELNLLINPKHPDFKKIQMDKPTSFVFDDRLFR